MPERKKVIQKRVLKPSIKIKKVASLKEVKVNKIDFKKELSDLSKAMRETDNLSEL